MLTGLPLLLALLASLTIGAATAASPQTESPAATDPWNMASRVKLIESRDPSGDPAYPVSPGDMLIFANTGTGFGSPAEKNQVVVINAKTKKVIAAVEPDIPVSRGSHGLGVSPDGRWVYIGNREAASGARGTELAILDARTLKVAKVLDVGGPVHHIKTFQDDKILVETFNFMIDDHQMPTGYIVLDPGRDNAVVGGIPAEAFGGIPYIAQPSPDGRYLYVTVMPRPRNKISGWLSKIDTTTWTEVGEAAAPLGGFPVWTAISPDGETAWVTNAYDSKVARVDLSTMEVESFVPTGPGPYGAVFSPDGSRLFVADKGEGMPAPSMEMAEPHSGGRFNGSTLTVIDPSNNGMIKQIPVGSRPDHLYVSPDGKELWITNNNSFEVIVLDLETESIIARIPMPNSGDPHALVFVEYNESGEPRVVADQGSASAYACSSHDRPGVWDESY